jgi:hypothetical protein
MKSQLPETFRPILWSYDFDRLDPVKHRKTIIIQANNYGTLAYKKEADQWLRAQIAGKLLHVFNMRQFQTWSNGDEL